MIRPTFKLSLTAASVAALLCGAGALMARAAEPNIRLPAPKADLPAAAGTRSVVLAGGYF